MHGLIELILFIVYFGGVPAAGAWLIWRSCPPPAPATTVLAAMGTSSAWPDDLTAVMDATREPSGEAGECVITFLPPRTGWDDCGCLHFEGGYLSACRSHDPHWGPPVSQWAAALSEEMGE